MTGTDRTLKAVQTYLANRHSILWPPKTWAITSPPEAQEAAYWLSCVVDEVLAIRKRQKNAE